MDEASTGDKMASKPDVRWQELIDTYLSSLHQWQRIVSRSSPGPGRVPTDANMNKVQRAYRDMKTAEESLKSYEAEMGY
jgi:hypothetical protein